MLLGMEIGFCVPGQGKQLQCYILVREFGFSGYWSGKTAFMLHVREIGFSVTEQGIGFSVTSRGNRLQKLVWEINFSVTGWGTPF